MIVGIPKEIKADENRVALTPAGAAELVKEGHKVLIEGGAGWGSHIGDEEFEAAGAMIVPRAEDVWAADLVVKVKEPIAAEYPLLRRGRGLFCFLHLAANKPLTQALIDSGVAAIAYETVESDDGRLPLLAPMSEVAGRLSPQIGAHFLEKPNGGRGVLLGGVAGVPPARVGVVGGGIVGNNAALIALGLEANVTILDTDLDRLRYLAEIHAGRLATYMSNTLNLAQVVAESDLLIGAVLTPGAKAPKLISSEMVATMKPGSVIVDVAIDQGGCVETSQPTTHSDPVRVVHDVLHYAVTNIPSAVPNTSTYALTNSTLPWLLQLAGKGWRQACLDNPALRKGLNVVDGRHIFGKTTPL
ncbi:MAG: alanine dehydrogenase [Actinomycetota bacterium]|nr:alanine dehydrogenase [Actinomycetota bacterium]